MKGNMMTTEEIIKENTPLMKHIAKKFYNANEDDLLQAGTIGLLKAIKKHKNENGKFSTYAYDYIFGEMYNCVNKERKIKISKDYLKLAKKIAVAKEVLREKTKQIPSCLDIAKFLNLEYSLVVNVMSITKEILSLDKELSDGSKIYDIIKDKERDLALQIDLQNGVMNLSKEGQDIIKYRYYYDYTQQETAEVLGISQVSVSRREKKCLQRLKWYLE